MCVCFCSTCFQVCKSMFKCAVYHVCQIIRVSLCVCLCVCELINDDNKYKNFLVCCQCLKKESHRKLTSMFRTSKQCLAVCYAIETRAY